MTDRKQILAVGTFFVGLLFSSPANGFDGVEAGAVLNTLSGSALPLESYLADPRAGVIRAMSLIAPGHTTRAEIEQLFPVRDGGPQGISSTRYAAPPDMVIVVPFDQTGGTWSATNIVNGPVIATLRDKSQF